MKKMLLLSASLAVATSSYVLANETTVEITQTIAEPESGFPEGMRPDVMGVAMGMTVTEVRSVFAELPNVNEVTSNLPLDAKVGDHLGSGYEIDEQEMDFGMREGNFQVKFSPATVSASSTFVNVVLKPPFGATQEKNGEYISAAFGSGFTGSHVQMIKSSRVFAEPVDTEALKKAVIAKYGEPHLVQEENSFLKFYYAYVDGAAAENNGIISSCTYANTGDKTFMYIPQSGSYRFNHASQFFSNSSPFRPSERCDAGIYVGMRYGDLENVVQFMTTEMVDHVAISQDLSEFDRVASDELEKLKGGYQGTTEVPEL